MATRNTIAVIGGGIGGLAAALALLQRGVDVDVYEQCAQLKEVGAGIAISSNGTRVLDALGLKEALAQHKNMGELRLLSEAQCGLGQALEQLGQLDEAKQSYNAALEHCERIGHPNCEWQARYGLASCLLALGETDEAREQLKTSIEIVEQLRDDLPESVNIDDFMRDKAKVFDLLQEIEGSEN